MLVRTYNSFAKIYKVFHSPQKPALLALCDKEGMMRRIYMVIAAAWIIAVVLFYFFFTAKSLLPYLGGV